ncbi:MAG: amino acid permease, partial [Bacteroidetes bacterium]
SLFGALACFGLMFFMNAPYAFLSIVLMIGLYVLLVRTNPDKRTLAVIFQGVIFQLSRQLQVYLQKAKKERTASWRPSAIAISEDSFRRLAAFDLLRWISQKYGFGTYIHLIKGYLSRSSHQEATKVKERLIRIAEASRSNVYVDTMISPSYTSSIAQAIQLPGVAGTENNLILFEFSRSNPEKLKDIVDNIKLVKAVDFDLAILASTERGFGLKRELHIWITPADYDNATLMILLAYIILGHREWADAEIKIFALFPHATIREEKERLLALIKEGQLPISPHNIRFLAREEDKDIRQIISEHSADADLVILGFRDEAVKRLGTEVFEGFEEIGNILFVNAGQEKRIK